MKKIKGVKEAWVPCRHINKDGSVLDFTGLYEVSSLGRVRSLNYNHTGESKILSQSTIENNDGSIFYMVGLWKGRKRYYKQVHRLVLSSFKESEFFEGAIVNHKVERTRFVCDNSLVNLEWTTQKENVNTEHCKELLAASMKGKFVNRKDLSKVVKMTDLTNGEVTEYPSARETERALGMPLRTVSNVIRNQRGNYKKMNLHFEYID